MLFAKWKMYSNNFARILLTMIKIKLMNQGYPTAKDPLNSAVDAFTGFYKNPEGHKK
jgi:hypothetical protein